MLAMPISSSSGGSSAKSRGLPVTTFWTFDGGSKIRATNSTGADLATFQIDGSKSSFAIIRQLANAPPVQICTGEKSSMSSTTTMNVHGQQVTYKSSSSGLALVEYALETPQGRFRWKADSSRERELVDDNKQVIGVANLEAGRFDVLVNGDETFLDCLLAGWIVMTMAKKQGAKDAKLAVTGLKIIGALAGGGGA